MNSRVFTKICMMTEVIQRVSYERIERKGGCAEGTQRGWERERRKPEERGDFM
jgi:hypothetical protein